MWNFRLSSVFCRYLVISMLYNICLCMYKSSIITTLSLSKYRCNNLTGRYGLSKLDHWRCLSHLLPPEKHHLGLRPRGHRYTLPICHNELCKSSFYTTKFIFFLWFFFHLQCLIYSVLYYCITFAFVICLIKRYHHTLSFHFWVEMVSTDLIHGHLLTKKLARICQVQVEITTGSLHADMRNFSTQHSWHPAYATLQ